MTVMVSQREKGGSHGPLEVVGDGSDMDILRRKAASAEANGWVVAWKGPDRFTARKVRHGGRDCLRTFWVE